jgi:hypothetical protein
MKSRVTSHLLTKEHDSLILNNRNNPKSTLNNVNKGVINKLQDVAWEINEDVLYHIKDTLKPDDSLTQLEQREREKAYILRNLETDNIIDYLLENGNKFYFGWKYDKRGRSYSQGYHINPQGNAYRKAMLSYADKERLNDEGIKNLKYDIANHLGYDKETWFKRTVEANKILAKIFHDDIFDEVVMLEISETASEPELFIKAIYAYYRGVILGEPIGHNMGLDCTASGLQLMAVMACCPTTAENSNVHAKVERTYTPETQQRLEELEAELALIQ